MIGIPSFLESIMTQSEIPYEDFTNVFKRMLEGELETSQIAAILAGLRCRPLEGKYLAAAATAMRSKSIKPPLDRSQPVFDNCGTGGDGSNSFNISTTAAIVAASGGIPMVKHGNKSVSSKCGSADLLEEAGFPLKLEPPSHQKLFEETNFTFLFAPSFHPGMKYVMPVRKSMGVPTLFNLLGPLANPLQPELQLIGVGGKEHLRPVAEATKILGISKALIVHSEDGMDEISPFEKTNGYHVDGYKITEWQFDPTDIIKDRSGSLEGGFPKDNHKILVDLLSGKESIYLDAVAINAAGIFWLAGTKKSMLEAYQFAKELVLSKQTESFFHKLINKAKELEN